MSTLRETYLEYIAVLNERRFDALADHLQPVLTYNGEVLTGEQYQADRVEDVDAIPDLFFDVRQLVVEDDQVASRILFRCTPRRDHLGLPVSGRRLEFTENVFYRFVDDRIAAVDSVIDKEAIRRQLAW
jgi:predicted ester cyclase